MKILFIVINILGGIGVLATYAYGMTHHADSVATLWGGVPQALRPFYGIGMIAAALGYLFYSYFIIFQVNAQEALVFNRWGYGVFSFIYALILIPSILWMPLTFKMVLFPSPLLWFAIRLVLFLVALGAFLMIVALIGLKPHFAPWAYTIALVGSFLFFLHTFVLDALLWPYFFNK